METEEAILTRRSIRKYKRVKIEPEKIGMILEAGRAAPSAGNLQNWIFILVDEEHKRKIISEACFEQYWMFEAPLHIIICSKPREAERYYGIRGERLYSVQNCAAVAQNMMLMAHDQGLGSCWIGAFDEEKIKDTFSIPKEARPQVILTIGYANEIPHCPSKMKLDNVAYLNKWRNRIRSIDSYMGFSTAAMCNDFYGKCKNALEKAKNKIRK